jgi:hypothetical protein
MMQAAEKTGRDVGSYVLFMVIAAKAEVVVRVLGGEGHTGVALPGADHLHRLRRARLHHERLPGQPAPFAADEGDLRRAERRRYGLLRPA